MQAVDLNLHVRQRSLAAALDTAVGRIVAVGPQQWFGLLDGRRELTMGLDEPWLSFQVPFGHVRRPASLCLPRMLERNAHLPAGARIIGTDIRSLSIELPTAALSWHAADQLASELKRAVDTLKLAVRCEQIESDMLDRPHASRAALAPLFDEAGWPLVDSDQQVLCVPLDVPRAYVNATIEQAGPMLRLSCALLDAELVEASPESRLAVYLALWLAASRTRLVKPFLSEQRLYVEAAAWPQATALAHACAALSVALRHFLHEAGHLLDSPDLARTYLSYADQRCGSGVVRRHNERLPNRCSTKEE